MAFSANIVLPLFGLIVFGRFLRRRGQMKENFLNDINSLLYCYGIPALLFFSIVGSETVLSAQWRPVAATYLAVLLSFLAAM